MRLSVLVSACLWSMAAVPSWAQPARAVGLTMGYPAGVGLLWHVTEAVALRPDMSVTRSTVDTTTTQTLLGSTVQAAETTTEWNTSAGVSVLVTLHDTERLRLYAVPRIAWFRSDRSNDGANAVAIDSDYDGLQASGGVGAHYGLGDRVAVFGELGVQYVRQTVSSRFGTSEIRSRTTTTGVRSAVGLVLYF